MKNVFNKKIYKILPVIFFVLITFFLVGRMIVDKKYSADSDGFVESPEAVQKIYQNGVPQLLADGSRSMSYDSAKSVFPLTLFTGMFNNIYCDNGADPTVVKSCYGTNENNTLNQYDLAKQGNFNSVVASNRIFENDNNGTVWDGHYSEFLQSLEQNNLRFFFEYPDLKEIIDQNNIPRRDTGFITNNLNNNRLLGYYFNEEMGTAPFVSTQCGSPGAPGSICNDTATYPPPEIINGKCSNAYSQSKLPSSSEWPTCLTFEQLMDFDKQERYDYFKTIDPKRLFGTINTASWAWWPLSDWSDQIQLYNKWKSVSSQYDVISFDNYSLNIQNHLTDGLNIDLTHRNVCGIECSFKEALEMSGQTKPIFILLPAFKIKNNDPAKDLRFIAPIEARAAQYASIINGATGTGFFTVDNNITRSLGLIGASPITPLQYTYSGDLNASIASSDDVEKSRLLWSAITQLNKETADLTPIILKPTAKQDYKVFIKPEPSTPGVAESPVPIKTMLKEDNGKYYLIVVNNDDRIINTRFSFDANISEIKAVNDWTIDSNQNFQVNPSRTLSSNGGEFEDTFDGLASHIYEIKFFGTPDVTVREFTYQPSIHFNFPVKTGVSKVIVNGVSATSNDNGWAIDLPLVIGDNTIKIKYEGAGDIPFSSEEIVKSIHKRRAGDVNDDSHINATDLAGLNFNWGKTDVNNPADFNEDNSVDGFDLAGMNFNWMKW